jgi:hypothetical protein
MKLQKKLCKTYMRLFGDPLQTNLSTKKMNGHQRSNNEMVMLGSYGIMQW